jgi:hypothetical protein
VKRAVLTNYLILFVIFGIAVSARADALDNWFLRTSGTTAILRAATYGNGNFVVVGNGGVLLTSTDGSNWVSRSSGRPADKACATYGNGILVAAGGFFGNGPTNVLVSTNASNWFGLYPGTTTDLLGASYAGAFIS